MTVETANMVERRAVAPSKGAAPAATTPQEDTGPALPAALTADPVAPDTTSSSPPSKASPPPAPASTPPTVPSPAPEPASSKVEPASTPPVNNNPPPPPKSSPAAPAPVLPSVTMAPAASPSAYDVAQPAATNPPPQQTAALLPLGPLLSLTNPSPLLAPLSSLLKIPDSLLSVLLPGPTSSPSFETVRRPSPAVFATANTPSPSDIGASPEDVPAKRGDSSGLITGVVLAVLFGFLAFMVLRTRFMKRGALKRDAADRLSWIAKGPGSPDSSFATDDGKVGGGGGEKGLGSPFAMEDTPGRSNWVTFPTNALYASPPANNKPWHASQVLSAPAAQPSNYPPVHPTSPQFSDAASMHLNLSPRNIISQPLVYPFGMSSPPATTTVAGTPLSSMYSPKSWATLLASPPQVGAGSSRAISPVQNFIGRLSPFGNKQGHAREDSLEVMNHASESEREEGEVDDDASVYSCSTVTHGFTLPGNVGPGAEVDLGRSRRGDLEQPFPTTPTEDGVETFR